MVVSKDTGLTRIGGSLTAPSTGFVKMATSSVVGCSLPASGLGSISIVELGRLSGSPECGDSF